MTRQSSLQRERFCFLVLLLGLQVLDFPYLGRVVGAACGQLLHIRGEQNPGDVLAVGVEVRDGEELRAVEGLDELPDKDVALRSYTLA